jgi:hypothetical protein
MAQRLKENFSRKICELSENDKNRSHNGLGETTGAITPKRCVDAYMPLKPEDDRESQYG